MSQHSSLKARGFGAKHRNVLKRFERIKKMKTDGRWEDTMSPFGLPKLKLLKLKVRKVKEAKAEGAAGAAGTAGAAAPAAPAAGQAKAPAAKAEAKPKAGKEK